MLCFIQEMNVVIIAIIRLFATATAAAIAIIYTAMKGKKNR